MTVSGVLARRLDCAVVGIHGDPGARTPRGSTPSTPSFEVVKTSCLGLTAATFQ